MASIEAQQAELLAQLKALEQQLAELNGLIRRIARPSVPPTPTVPAGPLSIVGATTRGSTDADVVVIEYTDFQCPFCGVFAKDAYPQLKKEYIDSGRVLFVFRHLPLSSIHPLAHKAAEAAECAGQQGKFWEMHDSIFASQQVLDEASHVRRAANLGLDGIGFRQCLSGGTAMHRIQQDLEHARSLQIASTPTFLVGTRNADGTVRVLERFSGARPFLGFKAVLDRILESSADGPAR